MYLHTRKYLLTHKSSPYLIEGSSIDEPGQVYAHLVTLISRCILSKIVRQKVIILDLGRRLLLRLFTKMIVVVGKETWLFIRSLLTVFLASKSFEAWFY